MIMIAITIDNDNDVEMLNVKTIIVSKMTSHCTDTEKSQKEG